MHTHQNIEIWAPLGDRRVLRLIRSGLLAMRNTNLRGQGHTRIQGITPDMHLRHLHMWERGVHHIPEAKGYRRGETLITVSIVVIRTAEAVNSHLHTEGSRAIKVTHHPRVNVPALPHPPNMQTF